MHKDMILRAAFLQVTAVLILFCSCAPDTSLEEQAKSIHETAIVIDADAHPKPGAAETLNLGEKTEGFEIDFVTMKEGGLDAVFFSVPLLRSRSEGRPDPAEILEEIGSLVHEVERNGDLAEIALSSSEIRRIHALGKRAVLLGMETQDPFGGDIGTLAQYHTAGIRMITLTPEFLTAPDSAQEVQSDSSLSDFDKWIIEEMNRLGMIIDVSHTSDGQQMEIIRTSDKPVVASHSCARALNDIPREISDLNIQALVEKGGVVCVTFFPGHISSDFPDRTVTIGDLVDHIDHLVRIAGVDHVGFGSDFLGGDAHTLGLESAAGLPDLTSALLERDYSPTEIEKILGGNLLRLIEEVQESGG